MTEGELVLDRNGQFFFGGAPCVRRDITDAFFRGLEKVEAGYQVRLGPHTQSVKVEEAPLRVFALGEREGRFFVVLDADMEEPLDASTLEYRGDVPWCRVRGLEARFTPSAALALGREIADGRISVKAA